MSRVKLLFFCFCLLANMPSAVLGQILDQAGNILPPSLKNQSLEQLFIHDIGDVIITLHSPTVLRGLTFKEDKLWGVTSSGFGSTGSGVLYEIDVDTGTVISTLNISPRPPATFGLGYDLKRDLFIVTDCKVDMIFKVDPANGNVIDSFSSPGSVPVGAAYDSIRDGYWISDSNNVVDLVSPETGEVISSLPAPFGASRIAGTGYDPYNDVLIFHSRDSAETYLIKASDGTQVSVFPTSPSPGTNNGQGAAIRPADLIGYITNFEFDDTIFVVALGLTRCINFADVPPGYWAEDAIYKIFNVGITTGCSKDPLKYCPEETVTRAQMAVFLGRATHDSNFTPPPATGIFADVPKSYWAAHWIEQFYKDGITKGCKIDPHDPQAAAMYYCPEYPVTRTTMAIFLLRAKHGANYEPPPATGIFEDVWVNYWAADWIEQLYKEGITKGCQKNPLMYCPEMHVTRAQMAVFLARMLGL